MDKHGEDTIRQPDVSAKDLAYAGIESARTKEELPPIPDAAFTAPLLLTWAISLLGPFQFGFNVSVSGAVQESAVFTGHSSFQWSLCVAIFPIGGLVGSLITGPVGTIWSRRRGVFVTAIGYIVSGVIMMTARNIYILTLGRFLVGVSAGATGVFIPLYIREISAPNLCGTLGTGYQLAVTLGIVAGDAFAFASSGTYQSVWQPGWRLLIGFSAFIGVLQLILLPLLAESPCWLLNAHCTDDASTVLTRLRGGADTALELEHLQAAADHDEQEQGATTLGQVLRDRSIRRVLVISCVLQIIQQLSGINAVIFYANQFFEDAGLHDPLVGTILVGTVNCLSTIVSVALVDRAGRRPLLLSSCFGMLVAQVVVSLGLLNVLPSATIVSVVAVLISIAFFEFGLGPIPWLTVTEMLPPASRATAMSLATTVQWFFTFVVGLVFPLMRSGLGNCSIVPFTMCLAVGLVFLLHCVPETKGLSVEEVHAELQRRKKAKIVATPQ